MNKQYYVYIMTNKNNNVLYTGVTSDLPRRAFVHREGLVEGFTKRYNVHKLVYYETFGEIEYAIQREKQIKAGPRRKKVALVAAANPQWRDLFDSL